ncbi:hypothetical protein M3Y96_01099300 [Aphelenchoides besseyi]|nr:hypothetical protein M3Y96_01099300 [Aphelenchoides besseyi]
MKIDVKIPLLALTLQLVEEQYYDSVNWHSNGRGTPNLGFSNKFETKNLIDQFKEHNFELIKSNQE